MKLRQIVTSIRGSFKSLVSAQDRASAHAEKGGPINKALSEARENLTENIRLLQRDTGKQFAPVLGELLSQIFQGTNGKDKTRMAFRKAQSRGIELGGRFLETTFPRKWDSRSMVQVQLVEREEESDLDKLKGKLGGLTDADLDSLISFASKITAKRKDSASAADAARQMLADAMQEEAESGK